MGYRRPHGSHSVFRRPLTSLKTPPSSPVGPVADDHEQDPLKAHFGDIQGTFLTSGVVGPTVGLVPSAESRVPNYVLISLREKAGLSQQDLADELITIADTQHSKYLQITSKTVGRWERGEVVWPHPLYRRLLAEFFGCAGDELGFHQPRRTQLDTEDTELAAPLTFDTTAPAQDPPVEDSQSAWRQVRDALGQHRHSLAVLAESLHRSNRVPGLLRTGVISQPRWLPNEPVPLHEVGLVLDPAAAEPELSGDEPESSAVRPLATLEHRYHRYHAAVRDLSAPRLFENRLCFRLMDVDWNAPKLTFGQMGFFDAVDINEALAHEFAFHHLAVNRDRDTVLPRASMRRLRFRKLLDDPFALNRRPVMGAIGTLTIKGGTSPSFVLHQRDSARVAGGGGMAHLLPAGIFQPSSVIPEAIASDFSIWRNIQREYAEELLGHGEYDGSGKPIQYSTLEPFAAMDHALHEDRIRVFYLGVTLDALTLAADILTVAVIDPDTYDELFAHAVETNAEGSVPRRMFPLEGNTLNWLASSKQLSPGAAAALHLVWTHRKTLLI